MPDRAAELVEQYRQHSLFSTAVQQDEALSQLLVGLVGRIQELETRVSRLEEENRILKERNMVLR